MTPPRATASCWSICWKPRDKKFSPGIFCPGNFILFKKYTPQSPQTAACQRAYKHRPAGPWGPSYNLHRFSRWVVSSVLRSFQLPAADGNREACCSHTDPTSPITKCEDKKDPSHLAGSRLPTTPIVYQTRRENKRGNLRISPGIFRKQTPPFGIFTKGVPVC